MQYGLLLRHTSRLVDETLDNGTPGESRRRKATGLPPPPHVRRRTVGSGNGLRAAEGAFPAWRRRYAIPHVRTVLCCYSSRCLAAGRPAGAGTGGARRLLLVLGRPGDPGGRRAADAHDRAAHRRPRPSAGPGLAHTVRAGEAHRAARVHTT